MKNKINITTLVENYDSQMSLVLPVNSLQSKDFVLCLILLREELVETLEIVLNNFVIYFKLNKTTKSVCSLFNEGKGVFKASISRNSLEYAIHYLLKYFRDGLGEVDHIDIDFEYSQSIEVTMTIRVDSSKEITPEEMNKLLGL